MCLIKVIINPSKVAFPFMNTDLRTWDSRSPAPVYVGVLIDTLSDSLITLGEMSMAQRSAKAKEVE